jgi:succinoglycan biosynthesis protein ExoV
MDLIYFKTKTGNFGDDLNQWFWDDVLPGWRNWAPDAVLVGVGTILASELLPAGRRKLVLGSGVGYGAAPDVHANPGEWDIRCVRGPRSAAALGLPAEKGVVDPTVLLPELSAFAGLKRGEERIFIPHHASLGTLDWDSICAGTGIVPISPAGDAKAIIRRIATAHSVIAESMHAAIIADAFRVPWRSAAISKSFNAFKWQDWADSLGIDLEITRFFPRLRDVQAAMTRMRASPRPQGGPTAPATRATAPEGSRLARSLAPILAVLARRTLASLARSEHVLSGDRCIEAKKRTLLRLMAGVESDYA